MRKNRCLLFAAFLLFFCSAAFAQTTYFTTLTGANEPDGGDADGVGSSVVTISGNTLTFVVTQANLTAINGTHIHNSAGSVVVNFASTGQSAPTYTNGIASGTVTATTPATQATFDAIVANPSAFYVNVHSTEKPNGAIRGNLSQISAGATGASGQDLAGSCVDTDTAMCLNGGRFKVEATWSTPTNSNNTAGHAVKLTGDTGYFWFFSSANVEIVVKALNACSAFNSQWVFASGLTNVDVTLKVTDTQTGKTRTYKNPNGTSFLPVQDTAAFTCP
jgi:hypothetical protein